MTHVRPPAVAGSFYPGDPEELRTLLSQLLQASQLPAAYPVPSTQCPKALIVPHAGYIYSGPIAASAYERIRSFANRIRRVILLGPAHRKYVDGLALPEATAFETPLGRVELDLEAMQKVEQLDHVEVNSEAHALEHSLEVQLPFLQMILPEFTLVPLAVGDIEPHEVGAILESLWGGEETLLLVSSDLSHYLPYDLAKRTDTETAHEILEMHVAVDTDRACGGVAIGGLLWAARRKNLTPFQLDLRNSGDTAGGRGRVVGYGAFAFFEGPSRV